MKPQKIKLGGHTYEVLPQPIGYLMNELGSDLQGAIETEVEGVEGARDVGSRTYEVLKVFIPDLMPRYEFLGFASEEALKQGRDAYDRSQDRSPKPPQVVEAFKAIKRANGGEVLDGLKAVLDQRLLQKATAMLISVAGELMRDSGALTIDSLKEAILTSRTSTSSPTSPSTSGASDSTSSSEPSPIPERPESAD